MLIIHVPLIIMVKFRSACNVKKKKILSKEQNTKKWQRFIALGYKTANIRADLLE